MHRDKRTEEAVGMYVLSHEKFSQRTQLEYDATIRDTERVVEGDYDGTKEPLIIHSPICTTDVVTTYQRGKQLKYTAEKPRIKDLKWLCCRKQV
mmetsp:Transcript_13140/g.15948  ORF Transcript_13140/g.15948 Transcript_13140/m.15948 type:complete len:94 (-) Transcript_13140:290-571(-)